MPFSQKLVLWLHVAFVAFTIGPVTLAIMSTPRYIRQRDVRIVRYLNRITVFFTLGTLGVLIAGMALASMMSVAGKWWVIVSATLFIVALLLLVLVVRDQRKAIKALDEAGAEAPALAAAVVVVAETQDSAAGEPADILTAPAPSPSPAPDTDAVIASVERGRIAMVGGVVSLIWLVILVLMVWR